MQTEKVIEYIVNWLKDYATKAGVKGYVIGVSGGVDSGVVSTLCAMTGLKVLALEMPIRQQKDQISRAQEQIEFLKNKFENVVILGDKGYLSQSIQMDLFNYQNIRLEVPLRKNQIEYQPQAYILRKSRKRIETLFSQLCDQFKIRNNYAKTFVGFKTRILAKITALNVIQLINKQNNRNINNLKISIT